MLSRIPPSLRTKRTREMVSLVDRIIDTTRHISSQLRPAILDDLGLEAALEWQTQEFVEWSRCRCKLDLSFNGLNEQSTGYDRIPNRQEALTNIARHSHATSAQVRGRIAEGALEVDVHDNGVGLRKIRSPPRIRSA